MARRVYLVGSMPLGSTAEVFETVGAAFGARIRQIPDGELGERSDWITHLVTLFRGNPAFEESDEVFGVYSGAANYRRYRLRPGVSPQDITFGSLGYAELTLKSYDEFRHQRDAGKIAPGTRFQVDLVPAHSVLWLFVVEREQTLIEPVYNAALLRELDSILKSIPQGDLAIQLDIASAVFARLERGQPTPHGRTKPQMIERFLDHRGPRRSSAGGRPVAAALLLRRRQPSTGRRANRHGRHGERTASQALASDRSSSHAVPRDRFDDAYFAPLRRLDLAPDTELCLGLVLHRRHRGHTQAHGRGVQVRPGLCRRHRMRLWASRSENDPGVAAHPRGGVRICLIVPRFSPSPA